MVLRMSEALSWGFTRALSEEGVVESGLRSIWPFILCISWLLEDLSSTP